jgi:hypothetical protein
MRVWILVDARELLVVVGEVVLVVVDAVGEAEMEAGAGLCGIGVIVVQSMSVILFSKLENRK